MHAVTVRQPQAASIFAQPGPYKLRLWKTVHRGELLIHAARRESGDPLPEPEGAPAYGALLGVVDLVDCVAAGSDQGDDESGHVWVLANPRPFARAVPHAGRGVGLFQVADDIVAGALAEVWR